MRKRLWIAGSAISLLFLSGCGGEKPGPAPQPHPGGSTSRQPNGSGNSPIIVGTGSIHVRQYDVITPIDSRHAYIDLNDHKAISLSIGVCPPNTPIVPENCIYGATATYASPIALTPPWTLEIDDASGNRAGLLSLDDPDFQDFILVSMNYPMAAEDDNGTNSTHGDGEGYRVDANGIVLGGGKLTMNGGSPVPLTCPQTPSGSNATSCTIRIVYCNPDAATCK